MPAEGGVVSPAFLLVALLTPLLVRAAPLGLRRDALLVASLAFCAAVLPGPLAAFALFALVASGFVLVRLVAAHPSVPLLWAAIGTVLFEFWLFRDALPRAAADPLPTLGLSYVMFRVIHMLVDAQSGELPARIGPRDHVLYLLFYPAFLAGPIQRYQDFASPPEPADRRLALHRIARGAFAHVILAALGFGLFAALAAPEGPLPASVPAPLRLALCWLGFAAYLYASFAGYSELVRGFAGLAGADLPRNFDRPFAAQNFLDLWSRWHVSLSEWFKFYVFNPFLKETVGRARTPLQVALAGACGYGVTFLLMGLWHGPTARFALYGLVLGAGAGANKLFQFLATRRLGKKRYRDLTRNPTYARAARASAVAYFVLALGFFWIPADPRVGGGVTADAGAWIAGALLVPVAVFALIPLVDRAEAVAASLGGPPDGSATRRAAVAGLQLAAVALYLLAFNGTVPPLLYQFF